MRTATTPDARLVGARTYIDEPFQSSVDIGRMARRAGMSRYHFIRCFSETFLQTPHQYLRQRRLERAKLLLTRDKLSVTEICFEVGFEGVGSFSALFSRYTGATPTAYRRRQRQLGRRGIPGCFVANYARQSARLTD
jgi:AraC-like DNA-binding protein